MRLRACILAIAVVTPLRAFAQTPAAPADAPPPPPPPPVAAPMPPPPPPEPMPPPPVAIAAPMAPVEPAASSAGPKFTWGGLVDTYYMYLLQSAGRRDTLQTLARAGCRRAACARGPGLRHEHQQRHAQLCSVLSLNACDGSGDVPARPGLRRRRARSSTPRAFRARPRRRCSGPSSCCRRTAASRLLPRLTLDFGKFYTTAGAEVIHANKNWLYSRSLLFNNIPLLHTGARANLKVNDMMSLQASVVNGWNDDPDVNAAQDVRRVDARIVPSSMATIVATTYIGKEASPRAQCRRRRATRASSPTWSLRSRSATSSA